MPNRGLYYRIREESLQRRIANDPWREEGARGTFRGRGSQKPSLTTPGELRRYRSGSSVSVDFSRASLGRALLLLRLIKRTDFSKTNSFLLKHSSQLTFSNIAECLMLYRQVRNLLCIIYMVT